MIARLLHWNYKRVVSARLEGAARGLAVPEGGQTQRVFNRALFVTMGRLAKMDGRVSEAEVYFATETMSRLGLDPAHRQCAIDYFNHGKEQTLDAIACLQELLPYIGSGSALARLVLKTQCRLAFSKGLIRLKEKILLRHVAAVLGFDRGELLRVYTEIQVQDTRPRSRGSAELGSAYRLLELSPDADERQIRRAYRRLLTRYHPDKLMARGLPPEALRHAQDKFVAIREAYESITSFRRLVGP